MKNAELKPLFLAISLSSFTVAAQTGQIALWVGPFPYGVGSEFTALTTPSLLGSYSPITTETINGQTGFQTFCLQTGVTVDLGSGSYQAVVYNYTLSLSSVGDPDAFPLTEGAAWLYAQFAQGTLGNYDYANTGSSLNPGASASRATDAGALQAALWYLQGDQTWPDYVFGGLGNVYFDEAENHFGSVAALEVSATPTTDFGVEVMNLTDASGKPAQNQLVYFAQSVDDRGATLPLLATSLAGLAIFVRASHKLK